MSFATVNGIRMYYEVQGSGPPLVFAHGSGGNHLSWWQQVPFFSRHYSCIVFDHRAFGLSHDSPEPKGRGAFAEDLKGLLDCLGVHRVALIAHSMGARTGVVFTLRYSERVGALVVSGSNGGSVNEETYRVRAQMQEKGRPVPAGYPRALSAGFVARNPGLAYLYRQIMELNPPHSPDFLGAPATYRGSTHERLAATGVPILYVVGEEDALVAPRTVEIAASQIPQARLVRLADAGHATYYERPEQFNQEVLGFLAKAYPAE